MSNKKQNRDYRTLDSAEQIRIIKAFADYQHDKLPTITGKRFLSPDEQRTFREGVDILRNFYQCWQFCDQADRAQGNLSQHVSRMEYIIKLINKSLQKEMHTANINGEQVIVYAKMQSLRRGRPTEAESLARKQEQELAARAEAISALTGARVAAVDAAPLPERDSDTSRRKPQEPDLFSAAIADAVNGDTTATVPGASASGAAPGSSDPDNKKSLREWKWCLPEALANRINSIRDIRTRIASESETAKRLLESGAKPSDIEPHTLAARNYQEELGNLYDAVDEQLAILYYILTKCDKDYLRLAERYKDRGGYDVLVRDLKPYYDKLATATVPEASASGKPTIDQRAQRIYDAYVIKTTRDPEKEKQIHNIKAYFSRKDVSPTANRLQKMREYYAQAQTLGVDSDTLAGFQVLIDACAKDVEAASKP